MRQYLVSVAGEVNPARAGMIPRRSDVLSALASKPRASGDDPLSSAEAGARQE